MRFFQRKLYTDMIYIYIHIWGCLKKGGAPNAQKRGTRGGLSGLPGSTGGGLF